MKHIIDIINMRCPVEELSLCSFDVEYDLKRPKFNLSYSSSNYSETDTESETTRSVTSLKRTREEHNSLSCPFPPKKLPYEFSSMIRNIWSDVEETIAIGVIFTLFVHLGTWSFSEPGCLISWEKIIMLYNKALSRYGCPPNSANPKTVSSFRSFFKRMKLRINKGLASFQTILSVWSNTLNVNEKLLSQKEIEEMLLTCEKEKYGCTRIQKQQHSLTTRKNLWDREQELALYGSIVQYALLSGSLTKSSYHPFPWKSIKKRYETNLERLGMGKKPKRKSEALRRHFKDMRQRVNNCTVNPTKLLELYKEFETRMAIINNSEESSKYE